MAEPLTIETLVDITTEEVRMMRDDWLFKANQELAGVKDETDPHMVQVRIADAIKYLKRAGVWSSFLTRRQRAGV